MNEVTFSGGALAIITALVGALWATIVVLGQKLLKSYENQHARDGDEIDYLRSLLKQVAGSAQEAAAAGHEAVNLGLAAAGSRGRRM